MQDYNHRVFKELFPINVKETTILVNEKGNKEQIVFISPTLKKIISRYERMKKQYFKDKIVTFLFDALPIEWRISLKETLELHWRLNQLNTV